MRVKSTATVADFEAIMLARLDIVVDHERCVASKEDKIGQTLVHDRTHSGEYCGHDSPHIDFLRSKGKVCHCAVGGVDLGGDTSVYKVCLFSRRIGNRVISNVIVRSTRSVS